MDESALQKRTTPNSRRTDGESLVLSANTSRTRSSGNRKQERRRRGEARLRRPGSGSFVVTAVSPRRDGALLVYWTHVRVGLRPIKVGTRAGRHSDSAQRKRKRTREVPVRLSPPPVLLVLRPRPRGPASIIHFHWHQRAAGLVGRRCPACATWRHAGARGW
jgi:hypothetical protein